MKAEFFKGEVTFNGIREARNGLTNKDKAFSTLHLIDSLGVTHINAIKEHYFFVELLQVLHSVNKSKAVGGGA